MTKAAVGVRVKPEDEASKSSPNFLPGGGVRGGERRERGWGNKDARGRSRDSGFTICTCGLKSLGQCASDTANYERAFHPLTLRGDVGEGLRVKGRRRGAGKVNFKEGTDKKVNNRDLNHSGHLELQPLFPPPLPSSGTSSSYFRMF